MSMISGAAASIPAWGACWPANSHTRARAAARAVLIAVSAAGASLANASIVRETVGSEATSPNTPGSARSNPMSAGQSPPNPSVIARSVTTLAGSWIARGLRQGANPAASNRSSPEILTASVNSDPPACDTTPLPAPSTRTRG